MEIDKAANDFLQAELTDLIDRGILRSEQVIIRRLLERHDEMKSVYLELADLPTDYWRKVLSAILSTAAFWSPDKMSRVREAVKESERLLVEISVKAKELADLMNLYKQLREQYGISAPDGFSCPLELIDRAALASKDQLSSFYEWHVKDELESIAYRFDSKYIPDVISIIDTLAFLAEEHAPEPVGRIEKAATSSQKTSSADFYRALRLRLKEQFHSLTFTGESMATIVDCCLNLEPGSITPNHIKQWKRKG